jgi:peptidyl-dipeptidase Dcp
MERSGQLLSRAVTVFFNLIASNTNPQLEALQTEMSPKLSAHNDAIYLDPALYARVRTLYETRASLKLDPESLRLLERYHTNFVRAGARLSDADKTRLKQIERADLEGHDRVPAERAQRRERRSSRRRQPRGPGRMTDEQIATAAEAAKERKLDGKFVIALLNTTNAATAGAAQESSAAVSAIYRASVDRGWGGEFDTTGEIAQIVKLRAERAALLGLSETTQRMCSRMRPRSMPVP